MAAICQKEAEERAKQRTVRQMMRAAGLAVSADDLPIDDTADENPWGLEWGEVEDEAWDDDEDDDKDDDLLSLL